jgi:hypothetical protein
MAKKQSKKPARTKTVRFEPDRVLFMVVVVSVLTMVLFGALTTL